MVIMVAFLGDPPTFSQYPLIRREAPDKLMLIPLTENDQNNEIRSNIETVLGVDTQCLGIQEPSFPNYLKLFYNTLNENPQEKYLFIGAGMPAEALLVAFVLGSFYNIWIEFEGYTIPNQAALLLTLKKLELLRIIQQDNPDSLETFLDILSEQKQYKILNRKNMRSKVSYTLGILRRNGLIAANRGARGKLKTKLTLIGKELLENIIS